MNILAVTCMRNEGPYCLEWIAYHRALGFKNFLIYTHDCTDGTDVILDLIPEVSHVRFETEANKSPQWSAMRLADRHPQMKTADWAMFFDCDEFLCLKEPLNSISDLISSVPKTTDAIALQWHLFGSSFHTGWEDGLVLERFLLAAPLDFTLPAGHFFKTLFRPERFQKLGVHRPKNKNGVAPNWNISGTMPASDSFSNNDKRINLFGISSASPTAWLNHYSVKSVTEFMIKRDRGLPNRRTKDINMGYWAERNFNTRKCGKIQRFFKETESELDALSKIEGLVSLLRVARQRHQLRFDELMAAPENIMLFLHLSLLQTSTPPGRDEIGKHLTRLAKSSSK